MNDPEQEEKIHVETGRWLDMETVKALREFQLSRTVKQRKAAEQRLLEIKGRSLSELKSIERLMGIEGDNEES